MRVLVIDDHAQLRLTVRRMLETAGYEVDEAADGETGIRCYREARADLIITDILMPRSEGLETILALRRLDPTVRIMAVSGADEERGGFLRTARMFGAVRTLRKPFSRDAFIASVTEALASSASIEPQKDEGEDEAGIHWKRRPPPEP